MHSCSPACDADLVGRRPVGARLAWRRSELLGPPFESGRWIDALRSEPADLYRTALCDSADHGQVLWRLQYTRDRVLVTEYDASGPGHPAIFSVPPGGAQIAYQMQHDPPAGTDRDPITGEVRTVQTDLTITAWESDGIAPGVVPPQLIFAEVAQQYDGTSQTVQIEVPRGTYTIRRALIRRTSGVGAFTAVSLQDGTGVVYDNLTGAGVFTIQRGSPIYVGSAGLITLAFEGNGSTLTFEYCICLERDDAESVLITDAVGTVGAP